MIKTFENYINEEYDHQNNEFEIGDLVKINDTMKKEIERWCYRQKHLIDEIGEIITVHKNSVDVKFLNNNYINSSDGNKVNIDKGIGLYKNWVDLVDSIEDIGDIEEWEEN